MSSKELACFSGAAQHSSQSWYPSYNYTREVELSYSYTTLNRRELMVTVRSSTRLANTSLVLRKSSLSPSETKLDKDDNCHGDDADKDDSDGDDTDYDEEDGDDEPSKPRSTGSKREWDKEVLFLVFALVCFLLIYFIFFICLFGCTKWLYVLYKST